MDFFGAQAQARRDSRLLSWAFAACVLAVVLVLGIMILTVLRVVLTFGRPRAPFEAALAEWAFRHPGLTLLTALALAGFVGGASLWPMLRPPACRGSAAPR